MNKMKATLLSIALASTVIMGLSPTTDATSCTRDFDGFGEESGACTFSCSYNDWVGGLGSVDDNGQVEVGAGCGAVSSWCYDLTDGVDDGYCSDWSNSRATSTGGGGCNGWGDGGYWTSLHFSCYTSPGATASPAAAIDAFVESVLAGDVPSTADFTGVVVIGKAGVFTAFNCLDGEDCIEFLPACERHLDGSWACKA